MDLATDDVRKGEEGGKCKANHWQAVFDVL